MDNLYILAVTPGAGGTASIVAVTGVVRLRQAIEDLPKFLLPGFDWSCASIVAGIAIPLTKSEVFGLIEEITELDELLA